MARPTAKVINKSMSKIYDRIYLIVPKGEKAAIKAAAESEGKSLNAYIREAIDKKMEK